MRTPQAREIKYFIQGQSSHTPGGQNPANPGAGKADTGRPQFDHMGWDDRVFMHPGSCCFHEGSYPYPWIVYHERAKVACVRVRVRACVRAWVCSCVRACEACV